MATSNLKCPECGYEAKSEEDRQKHMQDKHGGAGSSAQRQNRQGEPSGTGMGDEE